MTEHPRRLEVLGVVGTSVRSARLNANWTQRELSRRSGVSQGHISRIERGQVRDLRLAILHRLFTALGVRYRLGTELPHVTRPQTDFVHSLCSAYVSRRLTALGWLLEREVEVGGDRSRGWIDILAFQPASRTLLLIEVKTEIHDLGAIERSLSWYRREAMRAARRFGWQPAGIDVALLVLDSQANHDRILGARTVFAIAFPGRAPLLQALIDGQPSDGVGWFLALVDPRSRRSSWLRATPSDGRRTPAPYVDYIDAARRLERRP